ncbi:MAG: hypothetical protein Q7S65_03415, partial [Nanoarchaeota archaeon]|nr:hypothetical protein [Nanoarchaeota archaeon]
MTDSETPEKKGGLWLSVRIGFVLAIVIYLLDILTVVYYSPLYVIPIHFLLTLGVTVSNVVVAFLQAKKNPKDKFARNWRWVSLVILVVLIIGGFFFV